VNLSHSSSINAALQPLTQHAMYLRAVQKILNMGFLKSLLSGFSILLLQACVGKATQPENAVPEATPVATAAPQANTGNTLPHFTVLDATGDKVDLQSFKGKKVFVNLWATWCPPCRAEMPSIEKLYRASDKENTRFVMLSLDNDFELAKKYAASNGLSLPIFSPASDLPDLFAVNGIPTTFIFNEAGELIAQREGSDDYNTTAFRTLFGAAR